MSAGWRTDPALSRNSKPPPFRRWRIHRRKEAFHGGVAPYVSGPAHRTIDAIVGHEPLELLACVLAAAVGVIQQGAREPARSPSTTCRDELRAHLGFHRPATTRRENRSITAARGQPSAVQT